MRRISVRRGVAVLVLLTVCLVPLAAFADEAEIHIPIGGPTPQSASDEAKIQPPIGLWDVAFFVLLEAIG